MTEVPDYGMTTTLPVSYDEAIERVMAALSEQGFGVLTTIDVQATLKQKLGLDTRRYVILGACNPPLAHRALSEEPGIGLLLPCNVIVYEADEPGCTVVSIVDPLVMIRMANNDALQEVAEEAHRRLKAVMAALA